MCRVIADDPSKDAENLLLVRGRNAAIVLNRYPYTMGALMVAPVAHIADFRAVPDETLLEINQLIKRGMDILDQAISPRAYNIGVNQGADAGAGLKEHLHVHLVPRWGADTNFMTVIGNARVLAEDVDSMYARLREVRDEVDDRRRRTEDGRRTTEEKVRRQ